MDLFTKNIIIFLNIKFHFIVFKIYNALIHIDVAFYKVLINLKDANKLKLVQFKTKNKGFLTKNFCQLFSRKLDK